MIVIARRDNQESVNSRTQIEFRGVYKTYKNGTGALKDFNLKINRGEFVFVVGPSGAGKSTFMKLIMREEKMSAGEIIVGGYRLSKISRRQIPMLRRTMGIVFQDFRLIPTMNVFDNIAFSMHIVGASKQDIRKRVSYALNLVGLAHKARSKPSELSGGEQQRVGLARALVNNPSLIIADEPTGNVDPRMSYEIVELLSEINRRGTTVIMVTHEHQLVRDFHRRVVMIENGTVVADNADTSAYYGGAEQAHVPAHQYNPDEQAQIAVPDETPSPAPAVQESASAAADAEPAPAQSEADGESVEDGAFVIGGKGEVKGGESE